MNRKLFRNSKLRNSSKKISTSLLLPRHTEVYLTTLKLFVSVLIGLISSGCQFNWSFYCFCLNGQVFNTKHNYYII